MQRRIVVTGCGVVSAAGTDLSSFWQSLLEGTCFIKPLQNFSAPGLEQLMGAEVELPTSDALPGAVDGDARRSRTGQLALAATRRAIEDAALVRDAAALERTGLALGTTLGEERQVGDLSERWAASGPTSVDAGFYTRSDNHHLASLVAARYGLGGPVLLCAAACSSGNAAMASAFDLITSGAADTMIVGGADTLTRSIYCGFHRMGALSKGICRPFDRHRDGVSFGEGAGVVVLEELEHATRRGARIYAEMAGYGMSNDAHHVTAPDPHGDGFARAMNQALSHAGLSPTSIDYVSAHGTGTQYNDLGEIRAMKKVFGNCPSQVPISSIKSMIGHTNGAASAIEAVACALALTHQALPPTANLTEPDPECDWDCVAGKGREARVEHCLNLAAGFGGFNVCVVMRRWP
ncbi:MAG: beta-ketoacyl-[acyl-carrier-protein] synthase family protein [Polyangiaceae bacterium]